MGVLSKKPVADEYVLGIIFPDCRVWKDNEYHISPIHRFTFRALPPEHFAVMKFTYHGCLRADKAIRNANFKCEELFCADIYDSRVVAYKINCCDLLNDHILTKQINFGFNPILKNTTIKTRNLQYSGRLFTTDCNIEADNVSLYTLEFDKILDDIYKRKMPAWFVAGLNNQIRPKQITINSATDIHNRVIRFTLEEPEQECMKTVDGYYVLDLQHTP